MHKPPERRKLTKAERLEIYSKCDGHCAYCGCDLEYKDMQVDHVIPINGWKVSGPDTLDNMLPACRSCNHYKSRSPLEVFRRNLEAMPKTLANNYVTYKNAVRYGLVEPKPAPVVFYFEKMGASDEEKNNPLTVEELRQISTEPLKHWIWIESLVSPKESAYFQNHLDYTFGDAFCCGYPGFGVHFVYVDYGKTWLAYHFKPDEVQV